MDVKTHNPIEITDAVGHLPYRIALAGGWIDQPFVSRYNPDPPGSMVVVGVVPQFRFMDRSGICSSTREIAMKLWKGRLPDGNPDNLVRQLYAAENDGRADPSGSQDMIGLVYPGINRLDYDFAFEGGVFPRHIESCNNPAVAEWLQKHLHILPVAPRPDGYSPLGRRNLDPRWIARLGRSGRDCYDSIVQRNLTEFGRSMNECMLCWQMILPDTVDHTTLTVDLAGLLKAYQSRYPGAMYSGCGGGYLLVASEQPIPGSFKVQIRV